jgi:hypothetical protein
MDTVFVQRTATPNFRVKEEVWDADGINRRVITDQGTQVECPIKREILLHILDPQDNALSFE